MIHNSFNKSASFSKKITIIALLRTMAATLQAAGGLIPIAGLFISPLATAPSILSVVLSARYGLLSYLLTLFLLVIVQPSEVLIFAFTTGLLGIGIGFAFRVWERRLSLIMTGAVFLFSGILIVLHVFRFPLLGPSGGSIILLASVLKIFLKIKNSLLKETVYKDLIKLGLTNLNVS
jgi:hypothetical protein